MTNKTIPILAVVLSLLLAAGTAAATPDDERALRELERARQELERAREELQRSAHELARAIVRVEHDSPEAQMYEFIADPDRAMLGVILDDQSGRESRGVRVVGVTPGGGAERAGLRAGDILLSLNGRSLAAGKDPAQSPERKLRGEMRKLHAGDEVKLAYERGGRTQTVVVLTTRPMPFPLHELEPLLSWSQEGAPWPPMRNVLRHKRMKEMNTLRLVALDEDLAYYFKTGDGVLVVKAPRSGALTLKSGDVIQKLDGEKVSDPVSVMERLFQRDKGGVKLEVLRRGKTVTIQGTLPLAPPEEDDERP